ncbi:MAG: argininosuccinate lyase [Paludibacteraceae bacterium]|nr:argininosuccinate lyase [Paludibacteraceae bacterium]MBQ9704638.1 argininosuccinate lyase [Paludibacteraceae bacterium]
MKLWDKGYSLDEKIERFTVGNDRRLDLLLAPYDILGTIAHTTMLQAAGLLTQEELDKLLPALRALYKGAEEGRFVIEDDIEDVHSEVELLLTRQLGDTGKKVHTGRSRNDQILLDLKLFTRAAIEHTVGLMERLFRTLQQKSEQYKDLLMPGYTHLQVAMPSSFGLWLGAYAESLTDDMRWMRTAFDTANLNPLGSAAGYGSSAPLDRTMTTRLLGFADLNYNSVYAQLTRGRMERAVAFAYASTAETMGRLAADCCLFNSQNFAFLRLPDNLTTGSSIMPHKKNPDVFELIRAHCNRLNGIPESIRLITTNLPSGYFRDMQLLKEVYLPLFEEADSCLDLLNYAVANMEVREGLMQQPLYQTAFSVEEVNRRAAEGTPFRDAYKAVAQEIADGTFRWSGTLRHTHEGSIGNLCNRQIADRMDELTAGFPFAAIHKALATLAGTC